VPLTVTAIESQRDKELPGKGTFVSYKLTVDDGTTTTANVELFQKKDSIPPEVGKSYENWSLEQSQYGMKIKKAGGFGGAGPRQRDPKESARIVRQHSQEMAIHWTALAHSRGMLPEAFKLPDLEQIVDWFQRDVEREPPQYGERKVKDAVPTGQSDLGDDPSFKHPKADLEGTPWAA
jgi:hypothetical protein